MPRFDPTEFGCMLARIPMRGRQGALQKGADRAV